MKTINVTEKNGNVVGLKIVNDEEDLMIITATGTIIRMSISGISRMGRNTKGVKLINIKENDEVGTLSRIQKNDETDEVFDDVVDDL